MSNRQKSYIDGIIEANGLLKSAEARIREGFLMLRRCYEHGGKALICGNGGSASDAEHITGELMKGFLLKRPIPENDAKIFAEKFPESGALIKSLQRGLPVISLVSQTSLITAAANDASFDTAFAQQVYVYGSPGDTLIAISTSGNAKSVINAAKTAIVRGASVLALTGETGGELKNYCDILINIPLKETYLIQEVHIKIYHAICADLEAFFFGGGKNV